MYNNIYYFYYLSDIGGTETFLYELSKKYCDHDLVIVYKYANEKQLERLRKYVRCIQFVGQTIECKKAFFNYGIDIIDKVEAEEYYLVIHADYEDMKKKGFLSTPVPTHPKLKNWIAVSQRAADGFYAVTGHKPIVSYNPFEVRKPGHVLKLISATRLSIEKGKARMIQLADALDKAGIKYLWTIFTNDKKEIDNPNIIYMQPRLDILDYIADADYLVQLSDNEGYCYSVVEALSVGVPVLVTPCPVFDEIGLRDGVNCYKLPFDMKNIDVNKIYNKIPKFTYTPLKDSWDKILVPGPNTWPEDRDTIYEVEATSAYQEKNVTDNQLGCVPEKGRRWKVDYDRMFTLTQNNDKNTSFVKVVNKIKPIKRK